MKPELPKVEAAIKTILAYLGEDPEREGLKETPRRVIKSWERIYGGYKEDFSTILTSFEEDNVITEGQIILLKDIEFYSTCEHHMLPFEGKAHVAYIPSSRVVGISKLARLVEVYARRLQIQERICNEVSETLMKTLDASATACVIQARHLCMTCRGVEKQNSVMVTSSLRGSFLTNADSRKELMALINGRV